MVPVAPEHQNWYRGEIGGQIGVLRCIHRIKYTRGSSPLVMNYCDNFSALLTLNIHPESFTPRWKQVHLI